MKLYINYEYEYNKKVPPREREWTASLYSPELTVVNIAVQCQCDYGIFSILFCEAISTQSDIEKIHKTLS